MVDEALVQESFVLAKKVNARVGQDTADDDEIVEIRTRHFDVARIQEQIRT